MTKLSHLHFTTNKQAANRILAMGEEPWRIHNVGFPAIDLISEGSYAFRNEVMKTFNLDLDRPIILFTQHSVTTEHEYTSKQFAPSIEAMKKLSELGVQIIMTYPNNDIGSQSIIHDLVLLKKQNIPGLQVHRSLGRRLYHGLLALAADSHIKIACVGNSSSGIKESPAFSCPTVNIGSRQQGRLRADNVIDVGYDAEQILISVNKCFYDEEFRKKCQDADNPYYLGGAGKRVADILAGVTLNKDLLKKKMTLRGEVNNGWFR
jgi:UDP-N-acetylglucosamine 2-epimerase (non-hydrolysing)/GDP/UDP-N,N'-diacetylbacillosamine 2-epimerase (hydrolysing)